MSELKQIYFERRRAQICCSNDFFGVSNRIFNAPRGRPKDLPADQRQLVGSMSSINNAWPALVLSGDGENAAV